MAFRGVLTHRKTRRLARLLSISVPYALGVLEALWHVTGQHAKDGGIGRMSNADIADEMFFDGDPENLIEALLKAGWLDQSSTCRLFVHAWDEYADDATDNYLARSGTPYANGTTPHMRRLSDGERDKLRARHTYLCAQNATPCDGVRTAWALPVPVPVPVTSSSVSPLPPKPVACLDDQDPEGGEGNSKRWAKPTPEELVAFFRSLGASGEDARDFWDYREAQGWMVGRAPMKNWRAAVRYWVRHPMRNQAQNGKPSTMKGMVEKALSESMFGGKVGQKALGGGE